MAQTMNIKQLNRISSLRLHWAITGSLLILCTIIDLGTKYFFYTHESAIFSRVQPTLNEGISYSIGINMALIILASVICLLWIIRMYHKKQINSITFILIMSGGLGNLIDRVVYGGVRDFIYIGDKIPIFNFIFNIADIFLILG